MTRVRGRVIAVMGDSHMEALGRHVKSLLGRREPELITVTSRRGWSTARYVQEGLLGELVRNSGADLAIVELGGNDEPGSFEQYKRLLHRAIRQLQRAGAREIVWIGPATATRAPFDRIHDQNARWQARALRGLRGVHWVDSRPITKAEDLRADGVHLTGEGYRKWASRLAGLIVRASFKHLIVPAALVMIAGAIFVGTVRGRFRKQQER